MLESLGDPSPRPDDLRRALSWYGHGLVDTPDGRLVHVASPPTIHARDLVVATKAAGAGAPVSIRDLHRRCRGAWITSWWLRGSVTRLVAAGILLPVPAPLGRLVYQWRHRDIPENVHVT